MNDISLLLIIVACLVIAFFLYKFLKPFFIHYDTSILFTGGIGSGKSLNSVKIALKLLKKQRLKVNFKNLLKKFINVFIRFINLFKKSKKLILKSLIVYKPSLYSNMPILVDKNKHTFCKVLTKDILTLKERIEEGSIVLIDECSALVNQYNWNNNEVRYHLNEFIQLFRHYVGGYLILNAQAESEVVKQVRSKMNSYYWCFDFQKFLFLFYRVRMLHIQISENETSLSSEFIEDNTKRTYGILPRGRYNSRYLKNRYLNVPYTLPKYVYTNYTYDNIVRFEEYESRCDNESTKLLNIKVDDYE